MSILSGLQRASFRGVPFYFRQSESPNFGRKVVVHNFVNTGSRYVEDLGESKRVFNIQAEIVEETWSAFNRAKKALEKALNTPGIGSLIHPTDGRWQVVLTNATPAVNIINELNVARYTLSFEVADKNIFPTAATGNKGRINQIFDKIFGENQTVLEDTFNAIDQGLAVYNDARDTIQELTNDISDVVSTINGIPDEVAAFQRDIFDFQASLTSLIQTPSTLSQRFTTIFNNISLITDNFENLFNISLGLVGLGNNRTPKTGDSQRTETINNNRDAVYNFSDVAATTIAYAAATNLVYYNQEQLDSVQKRLDNAFMSIDPDTVDDTVYYELQNLRNQDRIYLESIRLNLAKIVTQRTNQVPSSILAYNLYGDSGRASEIITLNSIEDPAFVSGVINVLSQ